MKVEIFESKEKRAVLRRYKDFSVLEVADELGNIFSIYSHGKTFKSEKMITEETPK